MILSSLNINLCGYGANEGKYVGEAHFKNVYGSVQVVLPPAASEEILKVCGDLLVANAREVANNLTAACIEAQSQPAIENKA